MSTGPESRLWQSLRAKAPKDLFPTRIENRHGGGVPDLYCVWKGLPFWVELKVAKNNKLKISAHQVAWHTAHWARGGLSFFLAKPPSSKHFHLIEGKYATDLVRGASIEDLGSVFLGHDALWDGVSDAIWDHYRAVIAKR